MDVVFLTGRILFASVFVGSALTVHLGASRSQGVEFARAMGAPAPGLLVPLTGWVIIAGALMIAAGLWADLGALLIIGFLIGITPIMHAYWKIDDPQEKINQNVNFTKNVALLGAALIIFYVYNQGQDLELSLTDALFGRI